MWTPNMDFKKDIMEVHLADKIKYCYQCGRCTDVCPIADAAKGRYDPRKLVMASLLGLSQLAVGVEDNFALWGCQVCDTCDEICPNDIVLTELFAVMRNYSVAAGEAPDYYTNQAKSIFNSGKAIPIQPAIARRREKMGLPAVPEPPVDAIKTIMKEVGLAEKLKLGGE